VGRFVTGEGVVTWDRNKRRTNRYGAVFLMTDGTPCMSRPATRRSRRRAGGAARPAVTEVTATRPSTHIGDWGRGLYLQTPRVASGSCWAKPPVLPQGRPRAPGHRGGRLGPRGCGRPRHRLARPGAVPGAPPDRPAGLRGRPGTWRTNLTPRRPAAPRTAAWPQRHNNGDIRAQADRALPRAAARSTTPAEEDLQVKHIGDCAHVTAPTIGCHLTGAKTGDHPVSRRPHPRPADIGTPGGLPPAVPSRDGPTTKEHAPG
jgi:hypothetical protein